MNYCPFVTAVFALSLHLILPNSSYAGPLKKVSDAGIFIGGRAPSITSMPVTKEFNEDGKILYKVKAIVKRASEDRNGRMTLITAKGTGLDTFFRIALPKSPLRNIPPLKAKLLYGILIDGKGLNNEASRRAKGSRGFVEPIEFGLAPGTHRVQLGVCAELDDHPIKTALDIKGAIDLLNTTPLFLTLGGIRKFLKKKVIGQVLENTFVCSNAVYNLQILAKVPKIEGKTLAKAKELLDARNLQLLELDELSGKQCGNTKAGRIVRQGVPAGKRRAAGSSISYRLCKEKDNTVSPANFAGTWQTNLGTAVFRLGSRPTVLLGTFPGSGAINGTINGRSASGSWVSGDSSQKGGFSIKLSKNGKRFSGTCSGTWTGKRQ